MRVIYFILKVDAKIADVELREKAICKQEYLKII